MSIKSKFFKSRAENYRKWFKLTKLDSDCEGVIISLNKAIMADPKDVEAYLFKSGFLMSIGQAEDSLNVLEHALIANPDKSEYINTFKLPTLSYIGFLSSNQSYESEVSFEEYLEYIAKQKTE